MSLPTTIRNERKRSPPEDQEEKRSRPAGLEGVRLLSQTEMLVAWAINGSNNKGVYGLDIQRAISESSGGNETISTGTLYSTLKRLRAKGLISSYEGDPVAGGAKRQYYYLTGTGKSVVEYANQFISKLSSWQPSTVSD